MDATTAKRTAFSLTDNPRERQELFDRWVSGEIHSAQEMRDVYINEIYEDDVEDEEWE